MTREDLQHKLASLEAQRAKHAAAVAQLDGAIGFCKGLIAEAGGRGTDGPTAKPVNRLEDQMASVNGQE